jgi:hypothetical protein
LVIVDGLNIAIEAIREFKSESRFDVCVKTIRNAVRKAVLGSTKKVS